VCRGRRDEHSACWRPLTGNRQGIRLALCRIESWWVTAAGKPARKRSVFVGIQAGESDRRGKAVHGNSEIRWAAGCRRLAAVGVIVPVGEVDVAKLMSATALPLAWFTQTKSGVEFASTPVWTVPHVVKSGVVGAASVP
jgi:hypothetical protein